MKRNNKGFSLVELLVAMAIAAIVSGSVGFLLVTSMRMYGRETTDVALQQELQITLNQIVDYAMESQTVVLKNSGSAGSETTDYLCLGTIDASNTSNLNAEIFFSNNHNLYMCKTDIANYAETNSSAPHNIDEKVKAKVDSLITGDLKPYLLAEYIDQFYVELDGTDNSGTEKVFDNPLSLSITLKFSKNSSGGSVSKAVSDKAVLRNHIGKDIYYNGVSYKKRADADDKTLMVETTTVQNEKMLGKIEYTYSSRYKGSLNVLEIVPDYSYDELQYIVGGNNGAMLNYDNTTYGASAPSNAKVTQDEMDAMFNFVTGRIQYNDITQGSITYNYYPNGGNVPAMIFNIAEYVGYYEYVGASNGGVFAYNSCEKSSDGTKIEEVKMYSKYYSGTPSDADYGWVWREAEGSLYTNISDGSTYTDASVIDSKKYKKSDASESEKRIYLKHHKKIKGLNNETFKSYVMIDVMEDYVPAGSILNTKYAKYDVIGSSGSAVATVSDRIVDIHSVNGKALQNWENAGNKVLLNVRTPGDLTTNDITAADMIIFGIAGDGGFDWAHQTYCDIKGSSYSGSKYTKVNYTTDITFEHVLQIYKKVINLESCIACPTAFNSVLGGIGASNLSKLYYMLYGIDNTSVDIVNVKNDTYLNKKNYKINNGKNYWSTDPDYLSSLESKTHTNGSGRELFTDYIKSFAGKELSSLLYVDQLNSDGSVKTPKILSTKTTDVLYIDETNGNVIIPAQSGKIIGDKTYSYSASSHSTWEQGDFTGMMYTSAANQSEGYNKPLYLYEIYSSDSGKSSYIHNEEKSCEYKFTYGPYAGDTIYLNQLAYNQGSNLMQAYTNGSNGALWLQVVRSSTTPDGDRTETIGDITVVGAGDRFGPSETDSPSKTYDEWGVKYRNMPVTSLSNAKIIYLSEEEYNDAKEHGLDIYSVVNTSKAFTVVDPAKNNHLIEAKTNPYDGSTRLYYSANYNYISESSGTYYDPYKYKAGATDAEKFVFEYKYHINNIYFQHFGKPVNDGNYKFTAKISATTAEGIEYHGLEDFYIVIRDEFDLD